MEKIKGLGIKSKENLRNTISQGLREADNTSLAILESHVAQQGVQMVRRTEP